MKKILFILILFISASVYGQQIKTYYRTLNANETIDSGYVKFFTDSLFAYGSNSFVAHTVERYARIFGAEFPNNFGDYKLNAKGEYTNYSQAAEFVHWNGILSKPSAITNLTGTNTGDNATNTQYSGLAASKQDALVSGTNIKTINGTTVLGSGNIQTATLAGSEAITNKTFGTFNSALDAGANDSYVVTLSPAPAAYTQGMIVIFRANTANTTGCTINVNGLGVVNIVKRVSTTMATGDILAQMFCMLVYNGTAFVILNPVVN